MYLKEPTGLPPKRHEITKLLQDFLDSEKADMEVVFNSDEYAHPASCRSSLAVMAKSKQFPIQVSLFRGRVFLHRTDISKED